MNDPLDDLLRAIRRDHPDFFSHDSVQDDPRIFSVQFGDYDTLGRGRDIDSAHSGGLMKYVASYLTAEEYLFPEASGSAASDTRERLIEVILDSVTERDLLLALKTISIYTADPTRLQEIQDLYAVRLQEEARERLRAAMAKPDRVFLVRQQLLASFRRALLHGASPSETTLGPITSAIMLSHSVLDADDILVPNGPERVNSPSQSLAIHLAANQSFYSQDDVMSQFDRTIRLWRDYGPAQSELLNGHEPVEILADATGMDLENMLAFAFGVWSYDRAWNPNLPRPLALGLSPGTDFMKVAAFMKIMATTPEEFSERLQSPRSQWDFLPFEMTPIIGLEDGWLLIDADLLMARVTNGLFYFVLDYLKKTDPPLAKVWPSVWGKMVEALVNDNLRHLAPASLGNAKVVFTEDDFGLAYPDSQRSDLAIDFGASVVVFEVVSGQLTVDTRIGLDQVAFDDDMEKIVYKKLRQLDATANSILSDPTRIFGAGAVQRPIQPVLVAAGGFPLNAATSNLIDEYITAKGLFADARISPLAVVDLRDLDMLEALAEDGESIADLVRSWKKSTDRDQPFKNWLLSTREGVRARPQRMNDPIHGLMTGFSERLGMRDENDG